MRASGVIPSDEHGAAAAAERMPLVILYVEDNATNARLLAKYVSLRAHASLLLADSAEAGVALALQQAPDLILMDMHLPRASGLDALRALRSHPRTAGIPVVAVSADAVPENIQTALAAGFDQYLTKPIDFRQLDLLLARYGCA